MDRIKYIMDYLNRHLILLNDTGFVFEDESFDEMIHSYGVAYFCASAAYSKNLDVEIAFVIGLLHDIGRIIGDDFTNAHGPSGSIMAERFLKETGLFDISEIEIISSSIYRHSKKNKVHNEYDEILKDADLIERLFFMHNKRDNQEIKRERISRQMKHFGLKFDSDK